MIFNIIFFLLICPCVYASNCLEPIGWGARAAGRGGVEVGIANDADALNSNPAGITQIKGKQLDIGIGIFSPKIRFKNRYGKEHTRAQYYPAPEVGFVFHVEGSPVAIGLGVFGNSGLGVHKLYIKNPYFKRKRLGDSKLAVAKAIGAIAYQVTDKFSVGLALHYYYINYYLASSMGPAYLDADKIHGFGYGAAIGLLYKPTKKWSFGLSYTFKPILQDLHTDDSKIKFFNTGYTHCRTKIENFGVPRKLAMGIAYHINKRWLIGMDLEWQQYSRAFNELTIKLTDMNIPPQELKLPFHFRDTYIFSIGTEYELCRFLVLRMGYSLSTDISKKDTHFAVSPLIDDFHNLSCGIGTRWKNYELNISYVYCFEGKGINRTASFPAGNPAPEFSNSVTYYKDMHFNICITYHFQ